MSSRHATCEYSQLIPERPVSLVAVPIMSTRAVTLSRIFGEDVSPSAWRGFKDHFELVKKANLAREVEVWKDAAYRSVELRLCLTGAPAEYIREEAAQGSTWVHNDEEILNRLERRYITTEAIEVRIIRFEEAKQGEEESLADFLTRLQRLAGEACASESADVKRKRVVWRFLDGLIDRDVRERLIRERWMKDEANAKEYDDVLKIAETARASKQAAAVTGHRLQAGGACAAATAAPPRLAATPPPPPPPAPRWQRGPGQLGAAPGQPARPPAARAGHVPGRAGQTPAGQPGPRAVAGRGGGPSFGRCYYCNVPHQGGWYQCRRRLAENPSWSPRRGTAVAAAVYNEQQGEQDFC